MSEKYEQLLERSVVVQEGIQTTLKTLNENTKTLNDQFVLHCASVNDISKEVKVIRSELLKYLKWAVVALILVLGGKEVIDLIGI